MSTYHQAHAPYITAVADALFDTGIPIVDSHANPDDPRDGAIHLAHLGADHDYDDGPQHWIAWTEESGWFFGIDHDGGSGLSALRWASIGVLPEPARVVEWLHRLSLPVEFAEMRRPHYRDLDDDDTFDDELAAYVVERTDTP